jgi:hypothetical protein
LHGGAIFGPIVTSDISLIRQVHLLYCENLVSK